MVFCLVLEKATQTSKEENSRTEHLKTGVFVVGEKFSYSGTIPALFSCLYFYAIQLRPRERMLNAYKCLPVFCVTIFASFLMVYMCLAFVVFIYYRLL